MSVWLALLAWVVALQLRERHRLARGTHEVRGPLCTAQLALDGLERSARVEAIALELRRAALALDDLSGRARAETSAVDVGRLLAEAAPAWCALAADRGVELELDAGPARVAGDRLRLAQACANLVANAIEHGGPGAVHVASSTVGDRALVEVRDGGPGLPAPVSELVSAARGRRSARGHGLAIAAAVAASHGGRLGSLPAERGARLVLELPAS